MAATTLVGILVITTGHLGGSLTHNENYLIEYAPAPIRRLAGVNETQVRPKPTGLASADLYLDVVAPALKQRCGTCHNERKRSGQLSLASFEALMKGGEAGAVIVRGAPDKSDLFRRISLPHDHKDFMPKEGKTPLTDDEVGAIRVWIGQGAPGTGSVSALMLDRESSALLERVLGLRGVASEQTAATQSGAHNDENDGLPTVQATSPQMIAALESSGFVVRPIAKSSNLLDVDWSGSSQAISPQLLDLLMPVAPQILRLSLGNAGLVDADMKARIADGGTCVACGSKAIPLATQEYVTLQRLRSCATSTCTALARPRRVLIRWLPSNICASCICGTPPLPAKAWRRCASGAAI